MEKSQMKNIVILKNLPSNLIEEAFVVLKSRKTAKRLEYIEKNDKMQKKGSYINEKYPKVSKHSWGENENYMAKIDFDGKEEFYQDTPFSKMDDYLINLEHRKFVHE